MSFLAWEGKQNQSLLFSCFASVPLSDTLYARGKAYCSVAGNIKERRYTNTQVLAVQMNGTLYRVFPRYYQSPGRARLFGVIRKQREMKWGRGGRRRKTFKSDASVRRIERCKKSIKIVYARAQSRQLSRALWRQPRACLCLLYARCITFLITCSLVPRMYYTVKNKKKERGSTAYINNKINFDIVV